MHTAEFAPPFVAPEVLSSTLGQRGFAVAQAAFVRELCGVPRAELEALAAAWGDLPPDEYLKDHGNYRRRRHGSFVVEAERGTCVRVPHRAHFQSPAYNALHGGMERWFAPMEEQLTARPLWSALVTRLGALFAELKPCARWFVEAHQFRIDTQEGIGRPTPEGAHRDGVDFVALFLVARQHVRGGETRVFDVRGPEGLRFTLSEPWTLLLLDDERVIHETTPIQPSAGPDAGMPGYRDTLVLTYRRGGFQEP
jgi:hypothetical protein